MPIGDRYDAPAKSFAGGMSQVVICNDNILERKVAIKLIPESAHRHRLRDELSALLKMRSKHVVQVYDVLNIGKNDLAIVQEFIDGNDLFHTGTRPAGTQDFLKLLWQIASGITDIHDLDVIHRDIKPNNMKIDPEGIVKIFDFGLAREEGPQASTKGFVGTPGFAAPELYADQVAFSSAVDVYAFGATALYLATGNLPAELLKHPPTVPAKDYFKGSGHNLSPDVTNVLNACFRGAPDLRPTMRYIRDLLAKHLLKDRHKALVVFNGRASYLGAANRSVSLNLPAMGGVDIHYDGFVFAIDNVSGDVYVNNRQVTKGDILPGACVVALGAPSQQNNRRYITFDLSHPEIVL